VFEQVGISKHPDYIPIPWDEKYHIDVCTIETQRSNGDRPFMVTGFEIKSCRADFTADKKWRNYIGRTDRFSFVTTPGIIKPNELECGIGLIEVDIQHDDHYGYMLGWEFEAGMINYELNEVQRFDLMYALATANNRMAENYRSSLRDRLDNLLGEIKDGAK
jgi:hypothetical protein